MKLTFHTLDVFTARPFTGNGLAVVIGADGLSDGLMQNIAAEFNLSETVFVQAPENPMNTARVRIFTPRSELPFAGHPTIGCAVLLASLKHKPAQSFETEIKLEEKAGLVPVKVTRPGAAAVRGQFTAPRLAAVEPMAGGDEDLAAMLGLGAGDIGLATHRPTVLVVSSRFLCIPVASLDVLKRSQVTEPRFSRLLRQHDAFAAYLYTRSGQDFRVRFYAPGDGIPEDPATGLAAAAFASQMHAAEALGDGSHGWRLEQGVEMGRPSEIWVEADVRGGVLTAVRVAGEAVEVMQGTLDV